MRRLRAGELIAAAGGVALLALLWMPWYEEASAWEAFAVIDVVLLLAAALAVATAVLQATRRSPALPVAGSVLTAVLGIVATVLVLVRVLDAPGERAWGLFAGLAAVAALAGGGWVSLRQE
jgi:hypothetical protein